MRVSDFHFDLPEELIAQHPPAIRGSSRMLVAIRNRPPAPLTLTDAHFQDLPAWLQPGDLLVLNDSRVLPSRLFATRAGTATHPGSPAPSGRIEVLLTEQLQPGPESSNHGSAATLWRTLCRPAKKVHPGETLLFVDPAAPPGAPPALTAQVVSLGCFGERTLRFAPSPDFYSIVSRIGHMPLPPYIRRNQSAEDTSDPAAQEDRARYQTVYAQDPTIAPPGSSAAPTAGLHFTPGVLEALRDRGVEIAYLTLHVGLGTFQPVRAAELAEIRLHAERYTLPPATAEALNRALHPAAGHSQRRIIAVGTTTTRTLEHIAAVAAEADSGNIEVHPHSGSTSIFLAPGHRFRIVSGLLTNFHLPESTLLMLVAAFSGPPADPALGRSNILAAYRHAVAQRYRFFSYGDCMLVL